jgi:hypothetical protein
MGFFEGHCLEITSVIWSDFFVVHYYFHCYFSFIYLSYSISDLLLKLYRRLKYVYDLVYI